MRNCSTSLTETLIKEFGPLLGGEALRRALGYRSASAFRRALRLNHIEVRVFPVSGRKGKYALTTDVAAWLMRLPGTGYPTASESFSEGSRKGGVMDK